NDFTAGLAHLLAPEGVVTLEFPHLQRLIDDNQFDTIYHEHFSYFSFISIHQLALRHQLKLIDAEELSTHGGSLRVYLSRQEAAYLPTPSVAVLRHREESAGFHDVASY